MAENLRWCNTCGSFDLNPDLDRGFCDSCICVGCNEKAEYGEGSDYCKSCYEETFPDRIIEELYEMYAESFEAQMPFEGAVEQMDRHYSELGKKANKSDIYAKLVAWNGIEKMGQIKKAIEAFYNTKLEAETFEAKGGKRMYCPNCKMNRTWNSAFKKQNMDYSKGEKPSDFVFYVCQKCDYAYDPKTGKKMEDNWREMFGYDAETFEAVCRDCYGTGGLYDSRLGIDDECATCGGTGESFEADFNDSEVDEGDFYIRFGRKYPYSVKKGMEWGVPNTRKNNALNWKILDSLEVGDEIDLIVKRFGKNNPLFGRKEGMRTTTVKEVVDGLPSSHRKEVAYMLNPYYRDSWKTVETLSKHLKKIIIFDNGETILLLDRPSNPNPDAGYYHFYFKKSGLRSGGQHNWDNETKYRRGLIVGKLKKSNNRAETFEAEIYDRQGNLRTVDDNFIEATKDKLQALHLLLEANRKQSLATNNQDTKIRLGKERYRIRLAIIRLIEFIDDPINHDGGDFMVSFGAETKLKKESCCCGATKSKPCLCMIQGEMNCSAKSPMCPCYREIAMGTKVEMEHTKSKEKAEKIAKEHLSEHPDYYSRLKKAGLSAETIEVKGDDKYYINNRPQWMPKLMKDSVEEEGEGTYSRHDKGYVAGLFLKSVNDARLNGILKQTNYQDSDVVGFIMPFDLITRKLAKDYEPLVLKDQFGKSNKYLVINGTPYNYDIFNSMLMGLPPTTEVRISGKPKYPLMFEFKFLNEHYLMFLAPYVGDDFDASQHGDYAKEVMSKSGAGFGFKKPPKAKKLSKEEAEKAYDEGREKIRKRMFYPKGGVGLYSPAKERFEKAIDGREAKTDFNDASEWNPLLEKALPLMTDAEMEDYVLISTKGNKEDKPLTTAFFEMIVEERGEGNDPDFDPEKADRNKDGEISDWERAVGNAVAKGIREHKEKKGAESRPVSYMVKSDAHKLKEASKRIHDKADEGREYPEWWKSKLSVARNNADQLADFLDYAVVEGVFESEGDHDHEEIDELIDKLNTVVDFAITFVHDGGYGGEPKGTMVDNDLGIKTEVVHYVEGSIQLNLVRDIDTNELLSVRFSLTGDPDQTPIVYLPLPEEITTVPEDNRVSAKS